MENENKIVSTKTYTITVTMDSEGKQNMTRRNNGFLPLELIGISDFIQWEVREQILGRIIPDIIKREVIE